MPRRFDDVDVAFVDRFEDLHRVAYRAAFAVLGHRSDAEDCAQEALARALVRWRKVSDYAPAWVARVSTNLAIDRARRDRRSSASGPERTAADPASDRRRDLVVALAALPRRQREAVVLRYLVDLPEAETASAMGCSIGTIKSATSRGLDRLRATLGPTWAWED